MQLTDATLAVQTAREASDPAAEAVARCRVHSARRALGADAGGWWRHD